MARIPAGEQLGNVTARPQRFDEAVIPGGAYGGAIGNAVSNIANEARRQQQIEQRKAELTQEAADKAQGLQVLTKGRDALADLHDNTASGIMNGQIDKTKAGEEWQVRSKEAITSALEGVPATMRESVQFDLEHQASRFTRGIGKAVEQRDQQDVRSGINDTLEYTQRLYATDPKAAEALANETLKSLGPFSGMDPAQIQKAGQTWKENTRYTKGYSMVNEARRDNASLDKVATQLDSEEFNAMDPQRKAQLMTTIEGYKVANIQKAESEARRRQAEEERQFKHAESQFNAASTIIATGKVLSPGYVEQVSKAVSGTPFELAFREQVKGAASGSAFGMQPLATMGATLNAARAQLATSGTDDKIEKRMKSLEHIYDQAQRDYKENPLQAASERGGPPVPPLDMSSVEGLVGSFDARQGAVAYAEAQVGRPVSPLMPDEAKHLTEIMAKLPVTMKEKMLGEISNKLGPRTLPLMQQISKDAPRLAVAGGLYGMQSTEGRSPARLLLEGDELLKTKQFSMPDHGKVLQFFGDQVGDAIPTPQAQAAAMDAAGAIYAKLMHDNGRLNAKDVSPAEMRTAISLVTGGTVNWHGRKILRVAYGASENDTKQALRNVTPQQIKSWGGVAGMTEEQAVEYITSAPLESSAPGRYKVIAGAGILTRPDGKPFEMVFP